MREFAAHAVEIDGPFRADAVTAAAADLREGLGRPGDVAFVFCDSSYLSFLGELCDILRVDGHVTDVVGCTARGRTFGRREIEEGVGCSVLVVAGGLGEPVVISEAAPGNLPAPNAFVTLVNPFALPAEEWLRDWNTAFPRVASVGGLASGRTDEEVAVFLNGRIVDGVAVPVTDGLTILPVLSQGCRPIGEPLTVTRAEHNVVYALGGQPAYSALENAFQSLSDVEKSTARGNLFAGIAGNEYVDEFKPGDFLIRSIIGADPNSGAVVIGDLPRIGQTLQYQLRDRSAAEADLARAFSAANLAGVKPLASLLFSCLGRGEAFFGEPNQDARHLSLATGAAPSCGFFGNGEIGPVAGRNAIHGHTAAAAIFVRKVE